MKQNSLEKPTEKASLVDLNSQYAATVADIKALGGELTPESEAMLESLLTALCAKTDAYGIVLDKLQHEAEYWKFQKTKCADAQRAIEGHIESLKERMRFVLGNTEGEALQGDLYRFFLAKAAPVMEINEELLPSAYKRTELKVSADRKAIEAALAAGNQIEGVTMRENKSMRSGRPK